MPRLREIPRDEVTAPVVTMMYDFLFGERDPVAEPGTTTGTPGDWWTVFANSPDIFEHAVQGFGIYRSSRRQLDPVLRELGQTRAGWAVGSQFVFSQHCKSCRLLGMSESKIQAIAYWQASDELKMKLRAPWQRQSAEIVNLNQWLAERSRRNFQCQTKPSSCSPWDAA